jgi:uncharacterized protein involved in tolerance to divalent cations
MSNDNDFEIKRTITKEDIPAPVKSSKYDGIYRSCGTLKPDEGIELEFSRKKNRIPNFRKKLKKRYPYRHFNIVGRKREGRYYIYILRVK